MYNKIPKAFVLAIGLMFLLTPRQSHAQTVSPRTISGTVISAQDRQPLIGVAVYVEGTTTGTTTDIDGKYTLVLPSGTKEVTFSSIGYLIKKIPATENDAVFHMVSLDESASRIDDAVVVAFGTTQNRETMVTAVTNIKPDRLSGTHSSTLSQTFAGNIAGVISTQASGEPGADGASFWIRGISTFGANTQPIYILDGVEITTTQLNGISPESIESFSVLKDAAATALYGSRGANGVMIITTKNGKQSDKISVNVNVNVQVTFPTSVPGIADGPTYMRAYNEARLTRGFSPWWSEEKIRKTEAEVNEYLYPNVDWYKMLFKGSANSENANISLRGGGNRVNYFLNVAMSQENGIVKNSPAVSFNTGINVQKYNFQSNVNVKVTNTTIMDIRLNTQLQYGNHPYASTSSLYYSAMRVIPVLFPATWPDDWLPEQHKFTIFGRASGIDGRIDMPNPYATLSAGYQKTFRMHNTASLRVDQNLDFITTGLKAWGLVSFYNRMYSTSYYYLRPHYYSLSRYDYDEATNVISNPELTVQGTAGSDYLSASVSNSGYREMTVQATLEYNRTFGKHSVGTTALYHQKETINTLQGGYEDWLPRREQGFAGRVSYNYDKRYMLEGDFGYNGSENFMKGHRWGFFPSIALGWMISNEPFWKNLKGTISMLKLRYSFGWSGNDYLDTRFPYRSIINMRTSSGYYFGENITEVPGNYISRLGNEDATWEVSRKSNCGLELTIKDELTVIADFFKENRSGIFMYRRSLPYSAGFTGISPAGNIGEVNNMGCEVSLDYNKVFSKDFSVSVRGSFTYAHNKVVNIDEPLSLKYKYQSQVGHSLNTTYGLVSEGLYKDQVDVDASPLIAFTTVTLPGEIKYKDLNEDLKIDGNDQTYIGWPYVPEIIYGFGGSVYFKHFDFSFFFQGRSHVSLEIGGAHPFLDDSRANYNIFQWIVDDHWSEDNPNPNAAYPRLDWQFNNNYRTYDSNYWLRNARFLRLKNVEIGYTFKDFIRIYCTGTNLFLFSPFKYWDPEMGSGTGLSYPLQRTIQFGIQLNF